MTPKYRANVWLEISIDTLISPAEWDRVVAKVLQHARLTRLPPGTRVNLSPEIQKHYPSLPRQQ